MLKARHSEAAASGPEIPCTGSDAIEGAEANLRRLLSIPDDYAVLFLQGGSRLQFSMVPMNLLGRGQVGSGLVDPLLRGEDRVQAARCEHRDAGPDRGQPVLGVVKRGLGVADLVRGVGVVDPG